MDSEPKAAGGDTADAADVADAVGAVDAAESVDVGCRPVAEAWEPTKPLRLPCERTEEPCDRVDNDADGITDPHCPTRLCTSDADCTFGGLLQDVDCNFNFDPPACTPIDGYPFDEEKAFACRGVLCPPGLKCSLGECGPPGTGLPGASCTNGWGCPIQAGCLPAERPGKTGGECLQYCQDTPCPDGFHCLGSWELRGTLWTWSMTCAGAFVCAEGPRECAELLGPCNDDKTCSPLTDCLDEACYWPESAADCNHECLDQVATTPGIGPVLECLRGACGL